MYCKYFGLSSYPFKTTPDLEMFYKHGSRQEILEALIYTVTRGDGIVKVTGEVGSGKTMLLRLLASKLPPEFEIIYINSPNLSAKDILLYICSELGIANLQNAQKFTLTNELKNKLVELHGSNRKVVMLIDEAQSMTYDALEELRLLSNIETEKDKLLQMVLFGQPELDVALDAEKIRQLKSRISYSMFVPALQDTDVQAYLNYRMRKAGYSGLDVFDLKISKRIQTLTQGLPRNINVVADKVLMSIFGSGDKVAKKKHLKALPELEAGMQAAPNRKYYFTIIALLILVIVSLSFLIVNNSFNTTTSKVDLANSSNDGQSSLNNHSLNKEANNSSSNIESVLNKNLHIKSTISTIDEVNTLEQNNINTLPDTNLNTSSEKTLDQPAVIDDLTSPYVPNQINYQIKNPSAIVGNPQQLQKMIGYHSKGKAWLESLDDKYVIQLSTRHIRSIDTILRFHKQNKLNSDSIYIVVDYNKKINKFRLKVFYLASSSFSGLSQEIDNLPPRYKSASPYIATVEQLVQNLRYTDKKLQEIGILNE